jgi:flagellar export protein FliJ
MKRFIFSYQALLEQRKVQYRLALAHFKEWSTKTLALDHQIQQMDEEISKARQNWSSLFAAQGAKLRDIQFQNWYLDSLEQKKEELNTFRQRLEVLLEKSQHECLEKMRDQKALENLHDTQARQHHIHVEKLEQSLVDEHFLGSIKKK